MFLTSRSMPRFSVCRVPTSAISSPALAAINGGRILFSDP